MNIKLVEQETGVSSQNIRFYEKQGLIDPSRNPINGYRTYSEEDVRRLKLIKMLRMLDVPISQIQRVFDHTITLKEAMEEQQRILKENAEKLEDAIFFCKNVSESNYTVDDLDVDRYMEQLDSNKGFHNYCMQWVDDYRKIAEAEHGKHFTFVPDGAITNRNEFTTELFRYADEHHLNLVITKEGMYPEFTIDGVPYTAERVYTVMGRVPLAVVSCHTMNEAPPEMEPARAKILRILHYSWPVLIAMVVLLYILLKDGVTLQNIILFLLYTLAAAAITIRNFYLYWNVQD